MKKAVNFELKSKLAIVFLFLFTIGCYAQTPTQTLKVNGLQQDVTVRKDARSIPYIEAKTEADLYFAQGFMTASDRLWQMDMFRRVARGETAELFGKVTLEEDKRWRKFGFKQICEESLQNLSPELKSALENYARGVNAYIATLDEKSLPVEFQILQYKPREWQPTDTLIIGKILSEALSETYFEDLMRVSISDLPKDKQTDLLNQVTPFDVVLFGKDSAMKKAVSLNFANQRDFNENLFAEVEKDFQVRKSSLERIGFYAEGLAASNNWVISGKRTKDGKAMLANDPHLPATAPGIWYLTHLSTASMRVSGVTFPGVPGIVLGHNESIAWGATNVGPDVQDLYFETFNAEGKYKTPTGWETPTTRKEEIKVRTNLLKTDTETVSIEVQETRNGVIFVEENNKKYSLKWTARDPKNQEFEAFIKLNSAKNWNDFQNSLKTYGGAAQNFVYADVKGNIGWYAAGKIPIRKTGEGELPYDGATNDGEWTGFISFEELPHLYNPTEGFIVTANQRIVGTDYKYQQMSRDAATPWRARRIYDLLKNNSKVTMDDVRDVQYDVFNIPVNALAKEIVKMKAASAETLEILQNWDGKMTSDSKGAVLANEIRACIANKITAENKPLQSWVVREKVLPVVLSEKTARWLPKQFANYEAFFMSCDAESQTNLANPKRLGADKANWVWGNLFKSTFQHPLAAAPLIGGQFATPNVGINGSGQTPNVGSSVSMRHIASAGNWDETRHVIPLGQSGNPKSPFYEDQFEAWRTGIPAIFPFTKSAVEKAAREVILMTP
ncbi:MAG TPA: penicillin acylase family protein [Pyrinomonadaceae bacterium]|nr:penicillin acylase family protein [Pyrinomonadaceae bacterium]